MRWWFTRAQWPRSGSRVRERVRLLGEVRFGPRLSSFETRLEAATYNLGLLLHRRLRIQPHVQEYLSSVEIVYEGEGGVAGESRVLYLFIYSHY